MKTNDRLYGEGVTPPPVPQSVIDHRCMLLKLRMDEELEKAASIWDNVLINELVGAISFWRNINNGGK